jgi:hypothetical protein
MSVDVPLPVWRAVQGAAVGEPWPPADGAAADLFVAQAAREGLLPLLFEQPGLPPAVQAALPRHAAQAALARARSGLLMRALGTLHGLLREEPFVVLKGADYATRLYPRPELRPMQDLDLLVPRQRLDAVCARLLEAGLRPRAPRTAARAAPSYYERAFLLDEVLVEVHQSFVQRSRARIDYEAVWRRRVPRPELGPAAARLEDADAVACHALSLAKDEFTVPLVRYVDLWLMLRGRPELVEAAAARAREWGTRRALFGALHQGARLLPELADARTQAAARAMAGPLARRFLAAAVLPPLAEQGRAGVVTRRRQLWRKFWLIDAPWRRVGFAAEHALAAARGLGRRRPL